MQQFLCIVRFMTMQRPACACIYAFVAQLQLLLLLCFYFSPSCLIILSVVVFVIIFVFFFLLRPLLLLLPLFLPSSFQLVTSFLSILSCCLLISCVSLFHNFLSSPVFLSLGLWCPLLLQSGRSIWLQCTAKWLYTYISSKQLRNNYISVTLHKMRSN